MGNVLSAGSNSLYVHLDKPSYQPGECVHGQVLLYVVTPVQAHSLTLKVEGREQTEWEATKEEQSYNDNRSDWDTRTDTQIGRGSRELFASNVELQCFGDQCLHPGQFMFPFTFMLPAGLPGSFEFECGYQTGGLYNYPYTKARVDYSVTAEIRTTGMLSPNVKHTAKLLLVQPMPRPPSSVVATREQPVTACCCFDRGSTVLHANVERDMYCPGDVARLVLQVDNRSSASFSALRLSLRRTLRLVSDTSSDREWDDELVTNTYPGVAAGEMAWGHNAHKLSLQLPPSLLCSTAGQYVHCQYELVLQLKASVLMSDVTLACPVAVYPIPPTYTPYTSIPPEWASATVAAPMQLELPTAPPIPPLPQAMHMGQTSNALYQPPQPYQPPGSYQALKRVS